MRPALLWTLDLDAAGEPHAVDVRRARVRSTDRFDYAGVQAALDARTADERLVLLGEVGRLREQQEARRGGISLRIPEQQISVQDGTFGLSFRQPLAVEGWNAGPSRP